MNNLQPTPTADLALEVENLRGRLDEWNSGQYDAARPHQRTAVSDAVDTIDAMLRDVHTLRSEIVTEIRRYDDRSLRRTDELLRKIRAERQGRGGESS